MVTLRLLLIAGMVAVTSAGVLEEALKGASCKVKELAADAKLNDDKFIDDMMDCMLSEESKKSSVCSAEGLKARAMAPQILQGTCPPRTCDACTIRTVRMAIIKLQRRHPRKLAEIMKNFQHHG